MQNSIKRKLWLLLGVGVFLAVGLTEWMSAEKLSPMGPFERASYDPPFTPAFLRRNEVLVRIKHE